LRAVNSVELLVLVLLVVAALAVIGVRARGPAGHLPSVQVLIGLFIGLLAAFAVLSLQTDLVPDNLEWIGTLGLGVVLGALILAGAYAAFRR
jgi:hypothetical protein